jgi:SSS family solute:Na+ symporter
MHPLDWFIVVAYLVWIVRDGLRRVRGRHEVEGYFVAKRSLPWWVVGLSVMATQLSAITLVGTTGQGYEDGMRFVQFYFGLPVAMIVLSLTVVPFFHRAKIYTAYEFLERRFDAKTRALTSLLFLVSRAASCGVVISAPAVILSIVLGWNVTLTVLALAVPTIVYTMIGGVQAVAWADVKQMVVIVAGVVAALVALVVGLPRGVGLADALHLAGAAGRLTTVDFTFDLRATYTFWSGLVGGTFLALGYFGCDQSQVQRYLTARSIDEARHSLLMSAFFKIPLQALILLAGVLVFVFYVFAHPPLLFNAVHEPAVRASARGGEYRAIEAEFEAALAARREAARAFVGARLADGADARAAARAAFQAADRRVAALRRRAAAFVREVTGDRTFSDVNYVFPTFVITQLPTGLVGLLIAAIFAAAMSTIAAELNALATASVVDFYTRHWRRQASERETLVASKVATGLWGAVAAVVATYAVSLGTLIEVVNRLGSFFYGSLFGVFFLAIVVPRARATGAFWGMLAGMGVVAVAGFTTPISYLWLNVIGAGVVVAVGLAVSELERARRGEAAAAGVVRRDDRPGRSDAGGPP